MENLLLILGSLVFIAILAVLMTFPTMWLWNWIMPAIFGLIKINIWKALGINLLCMILFKSSNSK